MESGKSNFLIGLGVGSIIGALVYRFSCSSKGKKMKEKINHAFHKVTGDGVDMIDTAKDQAMNAGKEVADKVAEGTSKAADKMTDGAYKVADKADDVRNKVHTFADMDKK